MHVFCTDSIHMQFCIHIYTYNIYTMNDNFEMYLVTWSSFFHNRAIYARQNKPRLNKTSLDKT